MILKNILAWLLNKLKRKILKAEKALGVIYSTNSISDRRIRVFNTVSRRMNFMINYGPFKGMKFADLSWNGANQNTAMFLGIYEQEVLNSLANISPNYKTFVNLGAADGYYGVGVLVNDMFENSYCYEISEKGQQVIRENAGLNNVANRVEIRGEATESFYKSFSEETLNQSVFLVDIEGAEFDLLNKNAFEALKNSIIFIELHDWFFEDGQQKLSKLKNDFLNTHKPTELTMSSRDLSKFEELSDLNDTDRWLICSEGRGRLMTWLRLDPVI